MHKVVRFFDVLEDHIRARLSRTPIIYAFFAGIGVVLFWRGVWETADHVATHIPFFTGPMSIILGALILLLSGTFVSSFIGNRILLSGILRSRKLTEKSPDEVEIEIEKEVRAEKKELDVIRDALSKIEEKIEERES